MGSENYRPHTLPQAPQPPFHITPTGTHAYRWPPRHHFRLTEPLSYLQTTPALPVSGHWIVGQRLCVGHRRGGGRNTISRTNGSISGGIAALVNVAHDSEAVQPRTKPQSSKHVGQPPSPNLQTSCHVGTKRLNLTELDIS